MKRIVQEDLNSQSLLRVPSKLATKFPFNTPPPLNKFWAEGEVLDSNSVNPLNSQVCSCLPWSHYDDDEEEVEDEEEEYGQVVSQPVSQSQ